MRHRRGCLLYTSKLAEAQPGKQGEVEDFKVEFTPEDMNVTIKEVIKETKKAVDITDAKVLVSGGRGIGSADYYKDCLLYTSFIRAKKNAEQII